MWTSRSQKADPHLWYGMDIGPSAFISLKSKTGAPNWIALHERVGGLASMLKRRDLDFWSLYIHVSSTYDMETISHDKREKFWGRSRQVYSKTRKEHLRGCQKKLARSMFRVIHVFFLPSHNWHTPRSYFRSWHVHLTSLTNSTWFDPMSKTRTSSKTTHSHRLSTIFQSLYLFQSELGFEASSIFETNTWKLNEFLVIWNTFSAFPAFSHSRELEFAWTPGSYPQWWALTQELRDWPQRIVFQVEIGICPNLRSNFGQRITPNREKRRMVSGGLTRLRS